MPKRSFWPVRILLWTAILGGVYFLYAGLGVVESDLFITMLVAAPSAENKAAIPTLELSYDETRIRIPRLEIDSPVILPALADTALLRASLNKGAVHYPDSALPEDSRGNVFLFGHSSGRAIEENPARTVFTKIDQLVPGNEVEIWRQGRIYAYKVTKVKIMKPAEAEIYLETPERKLTLSTCWPIGDPANRFVVEAEFVRSYPQSKYKTRTADLSS